MPVIVLIASTLAFWGIYWFFYLGGVDHVAGLISSRQDAARRAKALEQEQNAPLRAVDDPRDAATVLMLLIPRGGDPTQAQIAAIQDVMRTVFGFKRDVTERLAHARFMAGRAESFEQATSLFAPLLKKQLSADERRELVDLVQKVANIDGPSDGQSADIEVLERRIGLAAA
jgi:uncharacterized tellurite resistance protein B-like protein